MLVVWEQLYHPGARVVVTVTDYGKWKPPQPSKSNLRGRGLSLIRGLTSTATITPTTGGTTVTMFWPLPSVTDGIPCTNSQLAAAQR